jgi:DNA repair protein RadD
MKLKLYDYQEEAIKACFAYLKLTQGDSTKAPLLKLPTGSGKSLIQADMIDRIIKSKPTAKILCLCHATQIINQNYQEFTGYSSLPGVGIYCSKLGRKDKSQVLFSSIQSAAKSELDELSFDILFIDEAHLCGNKEESQYRTFINKLLKKNAKLRIIGLTATPWRMDGGCLISGENKIFTCIVYEVTIRKLIELQKLCPIVTPDNKVLIQPDLSDLVMNNATQDYTGKSQSKIISSKIEEIVEEALIVAKDRKSFLWFCPTIELCVKLRELLKSREETASLYVGNTGQKDREKIKDKFDERKVRHLISVNATAVGFNSRCVDCVVALRITNSSSFWIQLLGRGMRLFPGKLDCLLLDYGDNIARHGSVENIEAPQPKKKKGDGEFKMVKICPSCNCELHISKIECNFCGYGYPVIERKYFELAKGKNVLFDGSNTLNLEKWSIFSVKASVHEKESKKSIKLEFLCENKVTVIFKFLKFERHFAVLQRNAIRFIETMCFSTKAGESMDFDTSLYWMKVLLGCVKDENYEGFVFYFNQELPKEITIPEYLLVDNSKKYPEIVDVIYKREEVKNE